ncbi:MAG: Rrf2 family transcriptional regulator [Verrucomicrobia bacterium]|nr:Rrf2 family transcriptional regulator [Verrucomicrobiota bacterium]
MQNCRFAFAVHVMAVLAQNRGICCSSSFLAETVNTNPVVIRRLLIALQAAGLVYTQRGSSGGTVLSRNSADVSLLEIHNAISPPALFGTHRNEPSQMCAVGRGIKRILNQVENRMITAIEHELKQITLADVVRQLNQRSRQKKSFRM